MEKSIKVHLVRYTGNHPVVSVSPDRVFEIAEMENAVVVEVNKQAKKEYGEGPQVSCSVGDRLSREQAIQIADTYETTLIAITSTDTTTEQSSLLKG
jgi:ribosomal protein L11